MKIHNVHTGTIIFTGNPTKDQKAVIHHCLKVGKLFCDETHATSFSAIVAGLVEAHCRAIVTSFGKNKGRYEVTLSAVKQRVYLRIDLVERDNKEKRIVNSVCNRLTLVNWETKVALTKKFPFFVKQYSLKDVLYPH